MEFNFGPFHFSFGKKKKIYEEENNNYENANNTTTSSVNGSEEDEKFTPSAIENVCDQCGIFDNMNVNKQTKQNIYASVISLIKANFNSDTAYISDCFKKGFEQNNITLNNSDANMCADAYLESYIYE